MSEALKIRLAARCEAAGRPENEDNFQVAENLSVSNTGFTTDKVFSLGSKGTLLLVCDGMGGMNAGEVASAVGVRTIKELFASQLLTEEVLANDESVCMYLKRAIVKADEQIKSEASRDEAKRGMGSTAVMAWLLGKKVYVAWCGDSRCYRYNPATGLEQLSHDHSYVQDLVDTGQLSKDLAFDHPNKNIITRSLGDPRGAARPDVKVYDLRKGDVIMLCSDGLSDSLRDSEIERSISGSLSSMEACRDALWNDSRQAGWHDNVTVVLAQVVDENAILHQSEPKKSEPTPKQQITSAEKEQRAESNKSISQVVSKVNVKWLGGIACVVLLLIVGIVAVPKLTHNSKDTSDKHKQYEELCGSFSETMFNDLKSFEEIKDSINSTKNRYDKVCELAEELHIDDFPKENIVNKINKAIASKAGMYESEYDDESKADTIRSFKIK